MALSRFRRPIEFVCNVYWIETGSQLKRTTFHLQYFSSDKVVEMGVTDRNRIGVGGHATARS
jgi:hypothetical protein